MLSNQFIQIQRYGVLTRGKSPFYERSEGTEIEVGLLKMTDLDKKLFKRSVHY